MAKKLKNRQISLVFLSIIGSILLIAGTTTSEMNLTGIYCWTGDRNDKINPSLAKNPNFAILNLKSRKSVDIAVPSQLEEIPEVIVVLFKYKIFESDSLAAEKLRIESFLDELEQYWLQTSYGKVDINFTLQAAGTADGWYVLDHNRNDYVMVDDPGTLLGEVASKAGPFTNLCGTTTPCDYVLIWLYDKFISTGTTVMDGFFTQGPNGEIAIGSETKPVAILGVDDNDFDSAITPDQYIWGKAAHIMGHLFGFEHTHSDRGFEKVDYPVEDSRYALMGRYLPLTSPSADIYQINYPVDLSIFSRTRQQMTQNWPISTYIKEINPGETGTYNVLPRSHQTVAANQWQFLKIPIDSIGSSYYGVEVIDNTFNDELTPSQGVLIYKVTADNRIVEIDSNTNQPVGTEKVAILYDTSIGRNLFVDEGTTDSGNDDVSIEITNFLDPVYEIKVTNQYPAPPSTPPDLMIEPWGYPPYESVDIWIDSPDNGYGTYQEIGTDGNRDIPALIHDPDDPNEKPNHVYARIRNIGEETAINVVVRFWDRKLTAGAGNGFNPIGEIHLDTLAKEAIDGEKEVFVEWKPNIGIVADPISGIGQTPGGACLYVNVTAENEPADRLMNNGLRPDWVGNYDLRAQENVHRLKDTTIAPGLIGETQLMLFQDGEEPVFNLSVPNKTREISFDIGNPFPIQKQIYVNFISQNNDWILDSATTGVFEFHTIPAFGNKSLTLNLRPNLIGAQVGDLLEAAITVSHIQVMGGEIGLIPFGGFEIQARAVHQTHLTIKATGDTDAITVNGSLSATDPNVNISTILLGSHKGSRAIRIDFRDRQTNKLIEYGIAFLDNDSNYEYEYSYPKAHKYSIYAIYIGSEKLGPSVSSADEIEIEESNWNLIVSIGAIFLIAIAYRDRKRRSANT